MNPKSVKLKLEIRDVKDLRPDPENPRVPIAGKDREALIASIQRFGFVDPILVSGDTIVDGHQRLDVWKNNFNGKRVVVIDVGKLTDEERLALNVATDKIRTQFDVPKLFEVLKALPTNLLNASGFTVEDLDVMKIEVEALNSTDTSFLNQYGAGAGDLMKLPGETYQSTVSAAQAGQHNARVTIHFVLTIPQRDKLIGVLNSVKTRRKFSTLGDAFCYLFKGENRKTRGKS